MSIWDIQIDWVLSEQSVEFPDLFQILAPSNADFHWWLPTYFQLLCVLFVKVCATLSVVSWQSLKLRYENLALPSLTETSSKKLFIIQIFSQEKNQAIFADLLTSSLCDDYTWHKLNQWHFNTNKPTRKCVFLLA